MADFIDRAKLEADALLRYDYLSPRARAESVDDFMAGVDAALALLDAETTEEWGVEGDHGGIYSEVFARQYAKDDGKRVLHRRVLYGPWLPSEGGESDGE